MPALPPHITVGRTVMGPAGYLEPSYTCSHDMVCVVCRKPIQPGQPFTSVPTWSGVRHPGPDAAAPQVRPVCQRCRPFRFAAADRTVAS